ncbi:insulin-degrading enzyme [Coccinella septempunctata]|uniref:insulin-degrading enzyme n=1 Tax=Coccinella septempunctata TaxID=41139 RepID=UPI001D07C863|nr:insulin-degrading enzyme [Coccinella septempunctata]
MKICNRPILWKNIFGNNSKYLFFSLRQLASEGTVPVKNKSATMVSQRFDNIFKSKEDKRLYRGLILSNQLKVLLVSDPSTDKSAAAMDVNVGYMSDPKNVKGLAHFCEHMLFLGTEKYPNENDYNKFLSEHGGSSNAATYPDHTIYYFDVVPEHLSSALDRFAQFFIAPLFTESATDKELNAVNSEHDKNVQSDLWRLDQLDKHLADPDHPYHTFGTGNRYTLEILPKREGINVREELLKFHNTWYSSNLMSLAVLGKESLDELEATVVELFHNVENKNSPLPEWSDAPFNEGHFETCTYIHPVKDVRNLNIIFPCKDFRHEYKAAPIHYTSHLMGHEGPGSILSALKSRGWSNSLVAGARPTPRGFTFFTIAVDLTEEGMKHTDEIIKLVFQYVNMLKQLGPLKWVHDENRDIGEMTFRFKDKESPRGYISSLVHFMQDYPMEDVLSCNLVVTEWKPEAIEEVWDDLVPSKIRVAIVAKKFNTELDSVEPWYGTKYKTVKIDKEILSDWENAGLCDELKLPEKNEFIPSDFKLYPLDDVSNKEGSTFSDHPLIIKDTALTRVWFKQDDVYKLPKANLMFDFVSPLAYLDPLNCNLTHMLVQLFRDALNEYAYSAEVAGLKYELINTKYGLILAIEGYNDKQHILLEKIIDRLTSFKVDPKRFEIYKENYIRNLRNFNAEQPYQHAVYYLAVLLTEHSWTKQELLGATEQLTIERLEAFIPQVLSKMHIECLVHGNVNKTKALEMANIVEEQLRNTLKMCPLLPRQLLLNRELKLEKGCYYLYEVQNDIHKPSCIELYYQCGMQSTETNMKLELFSKIIQEPCFNILRTKQQLGYIVFSGVRRSNGVQGLRIIVQSDKHPAFLDDRIEEFLKDMKPYLMSMEEEEFVRHREALAAQRLEKPKQLASQTNLYWSEITSQQYNFDRTEMEVGYLRTLKMKDILEFYEEFLEDSAKYRRKLSVQVVSMAEGGAGKVAEKENGTGIENVKMPSMIQDITIFKSCHEMYPLVQPFLSIPRKGNKCKL